MSLRVRMLGAFGYVLVFTLIALEIPLTLNFSRRVDSEIRAEASSSTAPICNGPFGVGAAAALVRRRTARMRATSSRALNGLTT